MKILLIGEYSGLHHNLALGLRQLGHEVTVASDGDGWKDYPRDINFLWNEKVRKLDIVKKLLIALPKMRGFDIVQLINPIFVDLKAENNLRLFRYLKKHNKTVFLGANGDDYYYIKYALSGQFSTSIFNHQALREEDSIQDHINNKCSSEYRQLNEEIATQVNGITACCSEYFLSYKDHFPGKLKFIPLPIRCDEFDFINTVDTSYSLKFFLGIQESRKRIKGMDIIYEALLLLKEKYPNKIELKIAQNVPFEQYKSMMDSSHILCDQLYSYGCGMNGAMAMAKGLIVAGGGEEAMYEIFGEANNQSIINLPETKEEVVIKLESVLENISRLSDLAQKSREFALKHHDHVKVAKQYLGFWNSKL